MTDTENIKCYGQPVDCRGWRQFMLERKCGGHLAHGGGEELLPFFVWVRLSTLPPGDTIICGDKHALYEWHESSIEDYMIARGIPRRRAPIHVATCSGEGRFIE